MIINIFLTVKEFTAQYLRRIMKKNIRYYLYLSDVYLKLFRDRLIV